MQLATLATRSGKYEENHSITTVDIKPIQVAFFVALLIIKLRIVATYEATCGSIDLAFGTAGGKRIVEVQDVVKEMLVDESLVNIESQREQVKRLIKVIHRNNSTMLPAILNPVPLLMNDGLRTAMQGAPAGATAVLLNASAFLFVCHALKRFSNNTLGIGHLMICDFIL